MGSQSWRIPRRSFLRGLGATLGLPALEAMAPARAFAQAVKSGAGGSGAGAAAGAPPVRFACIYFPNGVWQKGWIPKETGYDYVAPFALTPLEGVRDHVTVLSGLDKPNSRQGDGHYAKTANFLTGMPIVKTTGKDISAGGVSLDQLIASKIGGLTPLPSLELGCDPVISGVDSNVGFTRLYGSYISWRTHNTPMAKEINPRFVYERLFGVRSGAVGDAPERQKLEDNRSLLDLVLTDANGLRGKLGRDDQVKLDEYMDSVRGVEKRIEFHCKPDSRPWTPPAHVEEEGLEAPPGIPRDYRDHVRLMLDLMVLAFQTDSTRVVTFMMANSVSGRGFSFVDGVKEGHHQVSHHQNDPVKWEQYQRINRWHVEQYAYLLKRLASVREGEGTLLDNCMIVMGSGLSDGDRHDPNNLPILLGGRGGGGVAPGRHLAHPSNTPLTNLYVNVLDNMGLAQPSFGDSTGALAELMA